MSVTVIVRPEQTTEAGVIAALIAAAFAGHPHSDGSEPGIVDRLRRAGVLTISLVAVQEGRAVGHVAVSPVELSSGHPGWFGLGPVSVAPAHQRAGIGTALVHEALSLLRTRGASGCVVLGNPAYYGRFGFEPKSQLMLSGFPATHFMALSFGEPVPGAEVHYHESFQSVA